MSDDRSLKNLLKLAEPIPAVYAQSVDTGIQGWVCINHIESVWQRKGVTAQLMLKTTSGETWKIAKEML